MFTEIDVLMSYMSNINEKGYHLFSIKLCLSYCVLMILNYCFPNTFDVSRFNYRGSFGLANIFCSIKHARITLHDKAWP